MNVTSARDPVLDVLDCPDPSVKTPRRSATTTPLQALTMMNNPFVDRLADSFAHRITQIECKNPNQQVPLAYRLALGREPTQKEARACRGGRPRSGTEGAVLGAVQFERVCLREVTGCCGISRICG